jgi:hypothetical protein
VAAYEGPDRDAASSSVLTKYARLVSSAAEGAVSAA